MIVLDPRATRIWAQEPANQLTPDRAEAELAVRVTKSTVKLALHIFKVQLSAATDSSRSGTWSKDQVASLIESASTLGLWAQHTRDPLWKAVLTVSRPTRVCILSIMVEIIEIFLNGKSSFTNWAPTTCATHVYGFVDDGTWRFANE